MQTTMLYFAAFFLVIGGIAHSYLGERFVLSRLLGSEEIIKLFGNPEFMKATIRFAWHLTSLAWWGFAAIVVLLANKPVSSSSIGLVIGFVFLLHGAIALIGSRGQHLSWPVFLVTGILVIYATRA